MSKRKKFILSSILLSIGLLLVQFLEITNRYWAILGLVIASFLFSAWSLKEGLGGIEWMTALILPSFYTAGVGLFYFLLPSAWFPRIAVALGFAIGMYSLLLTENIFSVAKVRNIQLVRSAQAVEFLLTLLCAFFLFDVIFAYRLSPWMNAFLVFLTSFFLFFQALWSVRLKEEVSLTEIQYSLIFALILGEIGLSISFWPLSIAIASLFLITILYLVLGLSQSHLDGRLFKRTINEYLILGAVIFIIIFITTSWRG